MTFGVDRASVSVLIIRDRSFLPGVRDYVKYVHDLRRADGGEIITAVSDVWINARIGAHHVFFFSSQHVSP